MVNLQEERENNAFTKLPKMLKLLFVTFYANSDPMPILIFK